MALQIAAVCIISLSEIQTVKPEITEEWIKGNKDDFDKLLYGLGMDIRYPYDTQDLQHRNRLGNVISCQRFVGNERHNMEWVNSPYASCAAIDKSKNNSLLIDCYRLRGEVESV